MNYIDILFINYNVIFKMNLMKIINKLKVTINYKFKKNNMKSNLKISYTICSRHEIYHQFIVC